MKRALALILAAMLLIGTLAGCGGEATSGGNNQPQQTKATEPPREVAQTAKHTAAESFAGGSGTEADPFQISEAGHFVLLHEMLKKEFEETNFDNTYVKGHYVLTADIALNDTADFENWNTTAPEYGWEPIGQYVTNFAGVLDGAGHKVTGMYIDADGDQTESTQDNYGLFATMKGTVKNLTVEQSYIRVSGNTIAVGTIVGSTGYNDEALIENCSANSTIEVLGSGEAGGIAGNVSTGTVSGCSYSGSITQHNDGFVEIGGICGRNGSITGNPGCIKDCVFTGVLSGIGNTGGIVGTGDNVINCINKGSVSSDKAAGGIIGTMITAGTDLEIEAPQISVEGCINEGTVNGIALAGGIIADVTLGESDIATSVINCENKGQVLCDESAAGIIGTLGIDRSSAVKIENCVNHTDIVGKKKSGGIICDLDGGINHQKGAVTISGCKNLGNITTEDKYSAGIITYFLIMGANIDLQLVVKDCINEGAIQSTTYAGGILGFSNVGFNSETSSESKDISDSTSVSFQGCSNKGSVTVTSSNSMVGGIAGVLGLGYIPTEITNCVNSGAVTVDFTLSDEQIAESQGLGWTEFFQIGGGIVGRIGDALKLTTAEGVETSADNVNNAKGNIVISGCSNTGAISAPDYSFILNQWDVPLYMNYLGGVVGQCSATDGYAFSVENCTYTGAERGLGDTEYPDFGTKGA